MVFGDFGVPKSRGVISERTPSELREITVSVLLNRERTERNRTTDEQNKKEIFMNGCNENAIEFMTNGTKATLTFSQGRYKSVIRKLAEKHPDDCQIVADNEDGSICAHVPVAWIRISPPKQYTEEQRQQMRERLSHNISENTGVWE